MATLLDIITYEEVHYTNLLNEVEKAKVRNLAIKLWPLQDEISRWSEGRIHLQSNGSVIGSYFSEDLTDRIQRIASKLKE